MNPNDRFRKRPKKEEDFYLYDIEKHSKNALQKEQHKQDASQSKKTQFKSLEKHYILRFIASVIDLILGTFFLFSFFLIIVSITILGFLQEKSIYFFNLLEFLVNIIISCWRFFLPGAIYFTEVNLIFCLLVTLSQIIFIALFFALFERSKRQATLGKRLVGLIVMSEDGERIRFDQSFKRNFLKLLLFPLLGVFFDEKRAFHNIWTNSIVIKKSDGNKIIQL